MNTNRLRRYIAPGILVIIVLPFAIFAVPQLIGATGSYVVVSNSMMPQLGAGDAVFVYDVPPSQIEVGDVITYRSPNGGTITTHQVVDTVTRDGQRLFHTKGTANEEADPYLVPPEAVIGVVVFHIPYLGVITSWLGTDYGIVLFVIVPSALLILSELVHLKRDILGGDQSPSEPDPADLTPERTADAEANAGRPSAAPKLEESES